MKMFDVAQIELVKLPYPKHVTISFYGKKRGVHQRIDKKLSRYDIAVLGYEYFYFENNPAFEIHVKCRLQYVCAN